MLGGHEHDYSQCGSSAACVNSRLVCEHVSHEVNIFECVFGLLCCHLMDRNYINANAGHGQHIVLTLTKISMFITD